MLGYVSSIPTSLSVFTINVEFCQVLFLHLSRWSYDVLFFILLMQCIILIDLQMLNHPCSPGMNSTWWWCMILLMYYWIWLAENFYRCPMRLRNFTCIPSLLRVFIMNGFWILLYAFSPSIDRIMWFIHIYYGEWHWLIFKCWTSFVFLGWTLLGCNVFLEETV